MAADDNRPRLGHFFRPAAQNFPENRPIQPFRKSDEIDREEHLAAHRVNIGQGVGGRNRPEVIGVVDDRWEEIGCCYHRLLLVYLVNGRVIGLFQPYKEVRKIGGGEGISDRLQYLRQLAWSEFGRSTGTRGQTGKP